jgi:glycogen synthase
VVAALCSRLLSATRLVCRYLLLQANVFRHRSRSDIYSFASEHDMITWLSVVNQAVATVIMNWGVRRLQLHDYHGALSLQYLPKHLRPEVLYIAHNAHYNGVFALPTKQRRAYLYSMFNLNPAAVGKYTEHKSAFDTLHSLLSHMVEAQKGVGCAAVSPKYASEIRTRLSPFWQIPQGELLSIIRPGACCCCLTGFLGCLTRLCPML